MLRSLSHILLAVPVLVAFVGGAPLQLKARDDNDPARVPYVFPPPGTDPIADAIRARHGTLLALDGVLLNAPLYAQAWNELFGVVRSNTTLPGQMRELFILRTAVVNNAAYEWIQHEPVGRTEGLTTEQLLVIRLSPPGILTPADRRILGDELSAALLFSDVIAKNVAVPDNVYANLARFLHCGQRLWKSVYGGQLADKRQTAVKPRAGRMEI
ncbi:putative glycosidase C21B10.07 [Mycena kentingensis (nom. inval.)]|nr:putative glycosidase C21B10.07 [Mycena kentingensis (nom. inval.)]